MDQTSAYFPLNRSNPSPLVSCHFHPKAKHGINLQHQIYQNNWFTQIQLIHNYKFAAKFAQISFDTSKLNNRNHSWNAPNPLLKNSRWGLYWELANDRWLRVADAISNDWRKRTMTSCRGRWRRRLLVHHLEKIIKNCQGHMLTFWLFNFSFTF